MKILIGYDGSECADEALNDLKRAGLPDEGEALVLCAANVWPQLAQPPAEALSGGAADWWLPAVRDAQKLIDAESARCREIAAAAAQRFGANHPCWKVTLDSATDSPHTAIIQKADEWKPDLIVLGSHGRRALGRLILGSVSQSVLTHARCSVRIGRRGRSSEGPVKIVIGIDGSTESATAVSAVSMRKWPAGSDVRVVAVIDSVLSTSAPVGGLLCGWSPESDRTGCDRVMQSVKRVARELHDAGLSATPVTCIGDPKEALVQEAEKWGADCIFVGAKGHRRLERFLIGSVSATVAARAHCSVEVVRQPL